MYIKISWEQDFDDLMMFLFSKYGREIFTENGIGDQLDLNKFSKNFFNNKNTTADISVDENANVSGKSIIDYSVEFAKPLQRYNSHYLLWKELKKAYGLLVANEIIEKQIAGDIYINDFGGFGVCYCFNFSTYDIALSGLDMSRRMKISPPKSLESFIRQMEQFTVYAANSTTGATGLADILIVASHFIDKIIKTGYDGHIKIDDLKAYLIERITSFIYTLNWEFRGAQSAFTNISIYDKYFLENLVKDYVFVNGKSPKIETVQMIQKIFIESMNKELKRTNLTFPVTTACFSMENGNLKDRNFLNYIAEQNMEFGFINMFCGKTSVLSSCCFSGQQKTLTRSRGGIKYMSFEELYNLPHRPSKLNLTSFHNGSWCKSKIIRIPRNTNDMYKITTTNKKEFILTGNHINVTDSGDITTDKLTTNDFLAFNTRPLNALSKYNKNLTYEQGYLIGAYLGDGSKYKRKDSESYSITFSLGFKDEKDIHFLKTALQHWGIEKEIHTHKTENNVLFVNIYSKELFDIINEYVYGNYAHEKDLNLSILDQTLKFRNGIIDGWYMTDGGNSNRIYSTSKKLIDAGEWLFTSVGKNTVINISDRTGKNCVIIRGKKFNRNYPLYCIRWYEMGNKRSSLDIYKIINNTEFFKIKSIEKIDIKDEYVYCFEMEKEPYFTLPSGLITHNCRLRSDTSKKNEFFNSFGSGGTKIGSLGVVTVNFPRIAYNAIKTDNPEEFFLHEIKKSVSVTARINHSKRKIIKKRIELEAMPLYSLGHMSLDKQYSTYGVTGINEALEVMGYDITTKRGEKLVLKILNVINTENDKMDTRFKSPHNCEQVPAESSSAKLAKRDRMLKYQDTYEIYSNQFIPLSTNIDMIERLRIQGIFDEKFSGGSICHINIDKRITDKKIMKDLMLYAAETGTIYWAVNYVIKRCKNHHSWIDGDICPECGNSTLNAFTRVVGFFANVKNFSKVRRNLEFPSRVFYDIDEKENTKILKEF